MQATHIERPSEYTRRMATSEITDVPVDDLLVHPDNPRVGDIGSIIQSIEKNGWYGVIVAQRSTKHVLAGNHRLMAAQSLGMESVPVYWVDVDEATARRILIADNRMADKATYDDEKLVDVLLATMNEDDLIGTGWDATEVAELLLKLDDSPVGADGEPVDPADPHFTPRDVESPVYEQTGDCPDVHELFDEEATVRLVAQIESTPNLPDDIKQFLISAAQRHTTFRFDKIAEFYTHAPAHVQRLFEEQVLVIIDFNKSVELGFVELRRELAAIYEMEYGND